MKTGKRQLKRAMIRKIFFLTISTFNQRDFKRFGIELLEKNGFRVEVWDFTNILFPHIARNHKPPGPINWSGHKVFKDKQYALKNLEDLDSDTILSPSCLIIQNFIQSLKLFLRVMPNMLLSVQMPTHPGKPSKKRNSNYFYTI